ncbi:PQQ-dependent sugar dehydrogenase [Citreimonas salinaria]|uniref:Glucose/arabinose dehydrogenase, beta-propeller fold n=1 Tax=Citreimonas salinaria TaxID=321339 RepID=A0A1H3NUB9_9RHOB|nr:PQQ-dependent sugar dehydrogenase [Citreimonas salinaria]SDY92541.1 Glucose/arabinose dehydrogenase, beta-propeller fold [Citreimonas salinaria]
MSNAPISLAVAALLLASPASAQTGQDASADPQFEWGERNTSYPPAFDAQFRAPMLVTQAELDVETIVDGLVHPWAIKNLPGDSGYLVTERTGTLRHVTSDGVLSAPIGGTPEVRDERQGGMLDVETGPNFAEDRMIYLSYAKPTGTNAEGMTMSATAVGRGRLSEDFAMVEGFEDIWVQDPSAPEPLHYGSRIAFDDQNHVFITTGERFTFENRPRAQQLGATWGKTIRLYADGSIPKDNPFVGVPEADDSIWSYGHRNIEGAQVVDGQLVVLEMGPQGGDEVNLIEPGLNYGWPLVSYGRRYDRFGSAPIGIGSADIEGAVQPLYFWDPVIAPNDFVVYDGDMFPEWQGDFLISALVAGGIVRLSVGGDGLVQAEERLLPDLKRTRDVEIDDDGSLLLITDQENGRLLRITR